MGWGWGHGRGWGGDADEVEPLSFSLVLQDPARQMAGCDFKRARRDAENHRGRKNSLFLPVPPSSPFPGPGTEALVPRAQPPAPGRRRRRRQPAAPWQPGRPPCACCSRWGHGVSTVGLGPGGQVVLGAYRVHRTVPAAPTPRAAGGGNPAWPEPQDNTEPVVKPRCWAGRGGSVPCLVLRVTIASPLAHPLARVPRPPCATPEHGAAGGLLGTGTGKGAGRAQGHSAAALPLGLW